MIYYGTLTESRKRSESINGEREAKKALKKV